MIDPNVVTALEELGGVLVESVPKLVELFKHGGRDAVITTLDGALVVARAKTDDDLKKKHEHDGDATPLPGGSSPR